MNNTTNLEKTKEYTDFIRSKITANVTDDIKELVVKYALTPTQHKQAYEKIEKEFLANKTPVKNPKIYITLAQTGAGKTQLMTKRMQETPNLLHLSVERFKKFNPHLGEIKKLYPTWLGLLTGIDSYMHWEELYQKALLDKYNLIVEIAPSTQKKLFNIDIANLKKLGYEIHIDILAVSKINSLISVHERFEDAIEQNSTTAKLTDFDRAIDSFDSMKLVLSQIVKEDNVSVSVWKRGVKKTENILPVPVLLTTNKNIVLETYQKAINEDEISSLKNAGNRIDEIKTKMANRNAPPEQFAQLEKIEEICKGL